MGAACGPPLWLEKLGDYFGGETFSVLGLVEERREQNQFRASGGNLAKLPGAVGGRPGDCCRLDALHAVPVQARVDGLTI